MPDILKVSMCLNLKIFKLLLFRLIQQRKEILEELETEKEKDEHLLEWKKHGSYFLFYYSIHSKKNQYLNCTLN
jgi:hypothetical protein